MQPKHVNYIPKLYNRRQSYGITFGIIDCSPGKGQEVCTLNGAVAGKRDEESSTYYHAAPHPLTEIIAGGHTDNEKMSMAIYHLAARRLFLMRLWG